MHEACCANENFRLWRCTELGWEWATPLAQPPSFVQWLPRCMWNLKLKWIEIENLSFAISSSSLASPSSWGFFLCVCCSSVLLLFQFCLARRSLVSLYYIFFLFSVVCLVQLRLGVTVACSTCACLNFITTRNAPATSAWNIVHLQSAYISRLAAPPPILLSRLCGYILLSLWMPCCHLTIKCIAFGESFWQTDVTIICLFNWIQCVCIVCLLMCKILEHNLWTSLGEKWLNFIFELIYIRSVFMQHTAYIQNVIALISYFFILKGQEFSFISGLNFYWNVCEPEIKIFCMPQ